MRTLLSSFILFLGTATAYAQAYKSFDIHYSVPCDFAGSGLEKNQFTELQNGNILLYRFEADSVFGIKHFMRVWCIDLDGATQWDRKFDIGTGDSVWLSASLKSTGNQAYLVYSHVDQSRKTSMRLMQLDETGATLAFYKLTIQNDPQVRNIRSLIHNQELVVSYDFLAADSSRSAGFGKIPLAAPTTATWFRTNELQQSTTLYTDENNEVRFVATKNSNVVDFSLDQTGVYQALQFPVKHFPESVMVFNGSRYYLGSQVDAQGIFVNTFLYKQNQTSGWAKLLTANSPSYHGSNAAGLSNSNGKIVIFGYGSVPHPEPFLSVFEENGTTVKTEFFNGFQPFNYNRGDLFKHSSGSLFCSKLGGVFTGTQFINALIRIDTTNFTSCNSSSYNYPYTDISIQTGTTTVTCLPENNVFSTLSITPLQDSFPSETACFTTLSLSENNLLSLEAYPNPFTESFVLKGENLSDAQITCFNLLGKELTIQSELKNNAEILLTPPADFSGLLICRIQTADGLIKTIQVQKMN